MWDALNAKFDDVVPVKVQRLLNISAMYICGVYQFTITDPHLYTIYRTLWCMCPVHLIIGVQLALRYCRQICDSLFINSIFIFRRLMSLCCHQIRIGGKFTLDRIGFNVAKLMTPSSELLYDTYMLTYLNQTSLDWV